MCKRTMYKRARIPMFLWERRACANSGAQALGRFCSPPQKRPGNEANVYVATSLARTRVYTYIRQALGIRAGAAPLNTVLFCTCLIVL